MSDAWRVFGFVEFIFLGSVVSAAVKDRLYVRLDSLDDMTCGTGDRSLDMVTSSKTRCTLACFDNVSCFSVFYNNVTKTCHGCSKTYMNSATLVNAQGTKHYVIEIGSCKQLHKWSRSRPPSGEYIVQNDQNQLYSIFCDFQQTHGYTYLNPQTTVTFNINDHFDTQDHVILRHLKTSDSLQYTARLEQLPAYVSIPISIQYNQYVDYQETTHGSNMGPYVYIGLLPDNIASQRTTQGYVVAGVQKTFGNCDGNGNSYFAFLFNQGNNVMSNRVGSGIMSAWVDQATLASVTLPTDYFSKFEIHFGGCGGFATSVNDVVGAAVGLKFDY